MAELLRVAVRDADDRRARTDELARGMTKAAQQASRIELGAEPQPELDRRRETLVRAFEDISLLFPTSPYSDDALWHAGLLAADAFWEFGQADERGAALRLLKTLSNKYPRSSLVKQVAPQLDRLVAAKITVEDPPPPRDADISGRTTGPVAKPTGVTLKTIRREALPGSMRVTLELEREPVFASERIDGPPRVFIDLQNTRASTTLRDAVFPYTDDVVRQIRVGRQLNGRTRVVLDLSGAGNYSVYSLYDPYRIVVDFERKTNMPQTQQAVTRTPAAGATWPAPPAPASPSAPAPVSPKVESRPTVAIPAPQPPAANSTGTFSLSRQLGLGIARIVIDPGHGGHDPGAKVRGLTEAEVTLDIALRLEKLLGRQSGVEVVLTRRADTYVQLEERTAIANQVGADLFLSIHANASDVDAARGIETYFLNFAANPEAEAIAVRENASSARTMRNLPDIVKTIAMNNKIDESRDFASMVQSSLFDKLRGANKQLRNLGVKQAPFMVLIGATMPSVLAEISFLTNKQEGALLKTDKYRQQIAEALYQGVMRYQQSLKQAPAVAMNETAN